MNTPRDASLEAALAHIFAAEGETRASWFALTGGERLFTAGQPADTLYLVRSGRLGVSARRKITPSPSSSASSGPANRRARCP
ncbi:hypothetical protein [Brevundimonas denitrificans]|uniref:hypothetical protein n=1 Tax=Brevundimonas denitrificans TaxID=1443434 RepID=UPI00352EC22F